MGQKPCYITQSKPGKPQIKTVCLKNDDADGDDDVFDIPFTLSHEHRHYRHHRHAYSEMTLTVYYCSKQKIVILREIQIMTRMTPMTLESGIWYRDIPKQRH